MPAPVQDNSAVREQVVAFLRDLNLPLQQLIRNADLSKYVGLHRAQIAQLIAAGEFPKPIKLSSTGGAVAWWAHEVAVWQQRRIVASRQPTAGE